MASINFHLAGPLADKEKATIAIDATQSLEEVKKSVAQAFSIAIWKGISFHKNDKEEEVLSTPAQLIEISNVAVKIDGKLCMNVPGPQGLPGLGGYFEIYPDYIGNNQRLLEKFGHMYHVNYLGKHVYVTDDPDIADFIFNESEYFTKELSLDHPLYTLRMALPSSLFVTDTKDPSWPITHKFLMKAMSAKAMRGYQAKMDHGGKSLTDIFKHFASTDKEFNAFPWCLKAAAQTIGEVVLNTDMKMLSDPNTNVHEIIHEIGELLSLVQGLYKKGVWYQKLPNWEQRKFGGYMKALGNQIDVFIKENNAKDHADMPYQKAATETESILDFMLHAVDEDGSKIPKDYLFDNVLTFLGAGQGSTASAFTWVLYNVSMHHPKADRLFHELIDLGFTPDGDMTYDMLQKATYLDWFIKESLRLFNPMFQPTRQAKKKVVLPGGYVIPGQAQVTASLHGLLRNPEHWKNALNFEPERWGAPDINKRHKAAYIPFASGARSCIGFNFALMEMKTLLARLVLNFSFVNVTQGPVVYDPNFTLYRPLNFMTKVVPRGAPSSVPRPIITETATKSTTATEDADEGVAVIGVGEVPRPPLNVLYGSNNQASESFASILAGRAKAFGFTEIKLQAIDESNLVVGDLSEVKLGTMYFIVTSTYNGEPPDNALLFSELLESLKDEDREKFRNIEYTVFGAGNVQWESTFQAYPNKVDQKLADFGGKRFFKKGSGNAAEDQDNDFNVWSQELWATIAKRFGVTAKAEGAALEDNKISGPLPFTVKDVELKWTKGAQTAQFAPSEGVGLGTIAESTELVDPEALDKRSMRLISIELPEGQSYRTGDHIEVFPQNNGDVVERFIADFGLIPEAVFEVKSIGPTVNAKSVAGFLNGKGPISVRDALTHYADLSGAIPRQTLAALSVLIPAGPHNNETKDLFSKLSQPGHDQEFKTFTRECYNVAILSKKHPAVKSVKFHDLLIALRAPDARRYSIASSPLRDAKLADVCVGRTLLPTGADCTLRQGLASGMLHRLKVGEKLWVKTKSSQESFHPPEDPTVPVIMIAAGSGIAPFLGYLQHRRAQGFKIPSQGGKAPCRLYYGTFAHDHTKLRNLVKSYYADGSIDGKAAYSDETDLRRFAQELLMVDGVEIWKWIEDGARIYVCGSANRVGAGVRHAIASIAQQIGGVDEPEAFVSSLLKEGRYSEDVFG